MSRKYLVFFKRNNIVRRNAPPKQLWYLDAVLFHSPAEPSRRAWIFYSFTFLLIIEQMHCSKWFLRYQNEILM
jgi:hypothetical protein